MWSGYMVMIANTTMLAKRWLSLPWTWFCLNPKAPCFQVWYIFDGLDFTSFLVRFFPKFEGVWFCYQNPMSTKSGLDLCRYPLFTLRCSLAVPDYSLQPIWEVICWSLKASWWTLNVWNQVQSFQCCIQKCFGSTCHQFFLWTACTGT